MKKRLLIYIFILILQKNTFAQLYIHYSNRIDSTLLILKDTNNINNEIKKKKTSLELEGFLPVNCDSIKKRDKKWHAYFYVGNIYRWKSISKGNLPTDLYYSVKNFIKYSNSFLKPINIHNYILTKFENAGYPFVSIQLDSISIENNKYLTARFNCIIGDLYKNDTLIIENNSTFIQADYLSKCVRFTKNQHFSQKTINQVDNILRQLPSIEIVSPSWVSFYKSKAVLHVNIAPRKSNLLDGIIGLMPNNQQQGKTLITGEVKLKLNNLFLSGKILQAEWKQIRPLSQQIYINYQHPFLLNTPFELGFRFELNKQDSAFQNVVRRISVAYPLGGFSKLDLFWNFKTSRIGSQVQIAELRRSFDYQSYGIGYSYKKLNNILFPSKGFQIGAEAELGNKTTLSSNDSIQNSASVQLQTKLISNYYWAIRAKQTIVLGLQIGKIENNKNMILLNDLYRLGGFKTFRGFDEQLFFLKDYIINSIEYRIFTDKEAYLYSFIDLAWFKETTNSKIDNAQGIGLGTTFATENGIFTIAFAVGKSYFQALTFNQSKIHFGWTGRF